MSKEEIILKAIHRSIEMNILLNVTGPQMNELIENQHLLNEIELKNLKKDSADGPFADTEEFFGFVDWFGTWYTEHKVEDYGVQDIINAYKKSKS